ncbi:hypothetical protein [Sphingomonas sp.]|uniref:hypothetical protein n=1 Tax=Sphingomonas sp. TaxID=28214 RepID=UPI0028A917B8|nr:hypothetical protein [Sphingomonas sp.]
MSTETETGSRLSENPGLLLAGGVAVGVVIGMLLPRFEREKAALAPLGRKLADGATAAVHAAKESGREQIESLIPNSDATKERVSALFGTVIDAAKDATAKR